MLIFVALVIMLLTMILFVLIHAIYGAIFFSRVDVRVLRTVFMLLHLICVRSGLFVLDSNFLYTDVQGLIDWLAIN